MYASAGIFKDVSVTSALGARHVHCDGWRCTTAASPACDHGHEVKVVGARLIVRKDDDTKLNKKYITNCHILTGGSLVMLAR